MTARSPSPTRIALPAAPREPGRREFPLLATAAPVVGSLVMWAVTGSPFALVFAFLGPVIAIGSMIDARRHGRRSARAEATRFSNDIAAALASIELAHQQERQALAGRALRPHDLLSSLHRDPEWWRQSWRAPIPVCLGTGAVPSGLEVEPPAAQARPDAEEGYSRVLTAAATLTDAPVLIDARDGIGIVGPPVPAVALARAIVAQLAFRLSPAESAVTADDGGCFGWTRRLPHPSTPPGRDAAQGSLAGPLPGRILFRPTGDAATNPAPQIVCVVAEDAGILPRDCRVLIRLDGAGNAAVERNPSGPAVDGLRPWFVSEVQAEALVDRAAACAAADGLAQSTDPLPDVVAFADLRPADTSPGRLPATFASSSAGAVVVDLVRDGPHAILGGTTGTGKSELLISWVLALATTCSPTEVNFLLVDFKGGSSFAAVRRLPHTVGLITDLDQAGARRALASLQAELRHRERVLAAAGARSLDELSDGERMPRLLILIDEFAVVVNEFPDLQTLFADLAGRGRSLGIHLVLCTQRPAGVIRDSLLANCSLRLSMRVNNAADSTAVIGTSAAAELPVQLQGRCLLSVGGAEPLPVQVAIASPSDAERIVARYGEGQHPVRRPWCEPLPSVISLDDAVAACDETGLPFGLADIPEEQSQPAAVYDLRRDGNLAVLGGLGAGKTGALAALRAAGELKGMRVVPIPPGIEGAWDTITDAVAGMTQPARGRALYLFDDVDSLLARFSGDHQLEFTELLSRLLREGSNQGSRTVLTAARVTSGIQQLVSLCDSRLILRMPGRQEHVLAGGDGAGYAAELGPGAGTWRGHRVQVARVTSRQVLAPARAAWPLDGTSFALVASGARATAEWIRSQQPPGAALDVVELADLPASGGGLAIRSGAQAQVLLGEPAAWQSKWGLFAAARESVPVVFSGCSVAELRALTGARKLPAPIGPEPGAGWILASDGEITRVQLPEWFPPSAR
ncbi:MAG: FtsK/SpoIIIE domain-containing protein [Homoserinimonas sp.]